MRIINKILSESRNGWLIAKSFLISSAQKIDLDVPYVSQFAQPEQAEEILTNRDAHHTHDSWESTGAEDVDEYEKWMLTMCGMACTSMVLQYLTDQNKPLITLANDAMDHGVYKSDGNDLSDMRYHEYVQWLKTYGLDATVYTRLSIKGIQNLMSQGRLVMISVNPNIRGYETAPQKQVGGHLVLVTGYDKNQGTIQIHNPSGFVSSDTQINHTLALKDFSTYYAGRGISIVKVG